jgi:hypothetical protein
MNKIIGCLLLIMTTFCSNAQNKKEQIEALNYSIDSLNSLLISERTTSNDKSNEIDVYKKQISELNEADKLKQSEIENLNRENSLITEKNVLIISDNKQLSIENEHLKLEIENLKKELLSEKKSEFICLNYTNSDDEPYSDLGFKNKSDSTIIKISTVLGWLEIISIDEFENYGIPKKAKAALGSWYAGEGNYFYYLEENGIIIIYKGWIDESDNSSYHWVICNNIE